MIVAGFENELLTTLTMFARAIRDHRRDPVAIREGLVKFIFNITPAERVVILPIAGAIDPFEPIGRNRDEGSKPIKRKRSSIR